jgi:hypothetical protein
MGQQYSVGMCVIWIGMFQNLYFTCTEWISYCLNLNWNLNLHSTISFSNIVIGWVLKTEGNKVQKVGEG